jgi:hypothetical protein
LSIQFQPIALGRDQSERELHVWDPDCKLDQGYANVKAIQCDCKWGAGLVEDEAALILYLFDGEGDQTIEVYFTQTVAVGPEREMNSWDVLLSLQPESLTLVYGEKPTDRRCWLTAACKDGYGLMESLDHFLHRVTDLNKERTADSVIRQIASYVAKLEENWKIGDFQKKGIKLEG